MGHSLGGFSKRPKKTELLRVFGCFRLFTIDNVFCQVEPKPMELADVFAAYISAIAAWAAIYVQTRAKKKLPE